MVILRLIRKDLLLSWTLPLWMAGSLVLNVAIQAFEEARPSFGLVFGSAIAGFLPVMISGREDRFRTNGFAGALPASRRQLVVARYLVGPVFYPAWVLLSVAVAWALGGGGFPADMLRPSTLAAGLAVLALTVTVMTPPMLRFGFVGFLVGLVGLQVIGLVVLVAGPRLGLRPGILAIEDAIGSVGPAIRRLRAAWGGAAFYPLAAAAVATVFALSCAGSCAMFARRDL